MQSKTTRKRKKHPKDFKREAVRLLETRGERIVADVAGSLGIAENLLHAGKRKYASSVELHWRERGAETLDEELKRLRRENAQLRQEREVLKKSVAFLARDRS